MKRFVLTLSIFSVSISGSVWAQDPAKRDFVPPAPAVQDEPDERAERQEALPAEPPHFSLSQEMWFYTQEQKRYDDPKQAVRRKAEQRTAARQARLAALRWYGYSNLRPQASASPWMSTYSPYWAGNSWDPYQHVGVGSPRTAVVIEQYEIRR